MDTLNQKHKYYSNVHWCHLYNACISCYLHPPRLQWYMYILGWTQTSMYSIIAYQVGHRPQKMKAWIKLCAFLVCSGSPHMTTMEFVSPGFGSWTVIEAPDICRVHITESFRTVNTPLPKDLQYQKLGQGHLLICLRPEPNVYKIQDFKWSLQKYENWKTSIVYRVQFYSQIWTGGVTNWLCSGETTNLHGDKVFSLNDSESGTTAYPCCIGKNKATRQA